MDFGERFLTFPDLFPARRAGEPWGTHRVRLDLPGGPYVVDGLSAAQLALTEERFGPLCRGALPEGTESAEGAEAAGQPVHRLFRAPASDFLPVDTRGWEYHIDFDHAAMSVRLAGLHLMARLDWNPALTGALWTSEDGDYFPGIFENFLRVLVAYRLVELGGVVLHSAGIAAGNGAFLFLGPSGAGKTTLSRLSLEAGHTVLSDDLNALLPGAPGPRVVKLPFTGDLGDTRQGGDEWPLRGLLRLAQGTVEGLQPLSLGEAVAVLYACAPFVNADPYRRESLLAVLAELATGAPAGTLTFSLAGRVWEVLARWASQES